METTLQIESFGLGLGWGGILVVSTFTMERFSIFFNLILDSKIEHSEEDDLIGYLAAGYINKFLYIMEP